MFVPCIEGWCINCSECSKTLCNDELSIKYTNTLGHRTSLSPAIPTGATFTYFMWSVEDCRWSQQGTELKQPSIGYGKSSRKQGMGDVKKYLKQPSKKELEK